MSAYRRLAPASLVAAIALAVAACVATHSSTSKPATTPAPPSSSPPSAPATTPAPDPPSSPAPAPATTPASEPSSSTVAKPNSAYPYAPKGVTYTGDEGAVYTFSIPAGGYSLNQQASYDPALDPDGSGQCLFGGELDYESGSGGIIPLGNGSVPITAMSPIEGPATEANYPAGNYRLFIYPETTCSWTVELWS
jgi:hypothetical protein